MNPNARGLSPLSDRVLIKVNEKRDISPGGIIIPELVDNQENEKQWGTVLAIGPKVNDVLIGDQVVYGRYAGQDTALGIVLREEEIIGREVA